MKTGFTLIEIMVVIVVIGILATLAVTHFGSAGEQAYDRIAQADLKLIRAAERIYNTELNTYYISPAAQPQATRSISDTLRLDLLSGTDRKWDYQTWANNAVNPRTCCARARRFDGPNLRTWRIRNTEEEPVQGGTCP